MAICGYDLAGGLWWVAQAGVDEGEVLGMVSICGRAGSSSPRYGHHHGSPADSGHQRHAGVGAERPGASRTDRHQRLPDDPTGPSTRPARRRRPGFPVASAQGGTLTTEAAETFHIGGATHFDLLNHPAVYSRISTRLQQTGPAVHNGVADQPLRPGILERPPGCVSSPI
jgi:hypothetical protein